MRQAPLQLSSHRMQVYALCIRSRFARQRMDANHDTLSPHAQPSAALRSSGLLRGADEVEDGLRDALRVFEVQKVAQARQRFTMKFGFEVAFLAF